MSPFVLLAVGLVGQYIMIGVAMPLLFVPLYALARHREGIRRDPPIHPDPSPSERPVVAVSRLSLLMLGLVYGVLSARPGCRLWVMICIAYHLFPLVNLPLYLFSLLPQRHSQADGGRDPLSAAVRLYASHGFTAFRCLMWIDSVHGAWPGLRKAWKIGRFYHVSPWFAFDSTSYSLLTLDSPRSQDGAHVFFFNTIGLLGTHYLLVQIDRYADEVREQSTNQRVQYRRSAIEDLLGLPERTAPRHPAIDDLLALPEALILGPGYVTASYHRR